MKQYLFLSILMGSTILSMQPNLSQKSDQLIQAIRDGDLNKVKALVASDQEFINNYLRKFANYGGYALNSLEKNKNNPTLAAASLGIAEYLQKIGAQINAMQLENLKKQIQLPAAKPALAPASKPAPAIAKPIAKAAPTPVQTAKPAPAIKPAAPAPVAKPAAPSKTPANYDELTKIVRSSNYRDIEQYLNTHSISNLNPTQLSTIISSPISSLTFFEGTLGAQYLQNIRRIVKLLLKNGFKPFIADLGPYERTRTGDFGPRAGGIQTPLTLAIKAGNLPEIRRLIENEDYDVNEADSSRISPLGMVVAIELGLFPSVPKLKNAKEIAQYLVSKGAHLYDKEASYRAKLKELGIAGY